MRDKFSCGGNFTKPTFQRKDEVDVGNIIVAVRMMVQNKLQIQMRWGKSTSLPKHDITKIAWTSIAHRN